MEGKRLVTAFWLNDIIKRKKVRDSSFGVVDRVILLPYCFDL